MAAVAGQPMAQQQQQQAPGTPAAADVCEFAAGVALRMWEQNSGGMVRRRTGNMYDFMCMGCLGSGGEADAYLVELTGITPPADPSPAQAAASAAAVRQHMPATARMLLGNMMMMRPAAALMRATYPAPSLQVGSLYVLKVCRPQQSSTGEQPTPAAACKFLRAAASHMHNEHMCYVALQGCEHVVHCFGYGSAAAVPPATTTSSPAAAAAAAAAAATPLSSSASSSSSAAAAAMGVATAVAAPSASSTPVTTAPSSATAAAAASVERPCLLLEYAPGGSIALLLKTAAGEPAGMTEEQAKCVIKHVATVLKDCHRERILFRDLHPGNIVFNEAAPGQRCYKLIDFGSAHMLAKGLGRGAMFGVPYYRVPEQLEWCYHHDTLDTAKLGLLLLELRTGEPPLPELLGKDEAEWLELICSVHEDILSCEQYQHLQRYACLSQVEREFVSTCLLPDTHVRPTVADLWAEHYCYFQEEGLQDCTQDTTAAMQY